jgi:hypothetical protein
MFTPSTVLHNKRRPSRSPSEADSDHHFREEGDPRPAYTTYMMAKAKKARTASKAKESARLSAKEAGGVEKIIAPDSDSSAPESDAAATKDHEAELTAARVTAEGSGHGGDHDEHQEENEDGGREPEHGDEAPKSNEPEVEGGNEDTENDKAEPEDGGPDLKLHTGQFSEVRDGHLIDIFGAIENGARDGDKGLDQFVDEYVYSIDVGPLEEIRVTGRQIWQMRASINPKKAMKDFCAYVWYLRTVTQNAEPEDFSNPFERMTKGGFVTPRMTVHLGIWENIGGHQIFIFSEIAGTGIAVDVIEAINSWAGYTTPGMYACDYDPWVNPKGGQTRLWRNDGTEPEYRATDGTWTAIESGRGSHADAHRARIYKLVLNATNAATRKSATKAKMTGLSSGCFRFKRRLLGTSCEDDAESLRLPDDEDDQEAATQGDQQTKQPDTGAEADSEYTDDGATDGGDDGPSDGGEEPEFDISGTEKSYGYSVRPVDEKHKVIATREEAMARARARFPNDPAMLKKIAVQIPFYQRGVAYDKNGKACSFGHNKRVRRLKAKCINAVNEYNTIGYNSRHPPPAAVDILALRFCSPHGEGNGSIFAMLGELDCLHLGDTRLPGGHQVAGTTPATNALERRVNKME